MSVVTSEADRKRCEMIRQRREDARRVEWAQQVVEWAWLAAAAVFFIGTVFGAVFVTVAKGG